MSHHPSYTMAGVTAAGGILGYIRKKSIPSLVAGLGLGSLFAISGYLIQKKGDDFNGHLLASICSFVLFGVGAWRYAQTRKPMPAIPLIVLGGVSLAYQGKKVKEWSH